MANSEQRLPALWDIANYALFMFLTQSHMQISWGKGSSEVGKGKTSERVKERGERVIE